MRIVSEIWKLLKDTVLSFIEDEALSRGAAIAFYTVTSAASLGLVAALGFLLLVSLVVSAALTAFGDYLDSILPFGKLLLPAMNVLVSLLLISVLFAAIYKVLPDRHLEWRDVVVGGVVTAILFTIGKSLIGWYIGSRAVASSYGAAGALIVLLLGFITQFKCFCSERNSPRSMLAAMAASKQNRSQQSGIHIRW